MFAIPMRVQRSKLIHKSQDEISSYIGDFHNWRTWSPWLCQEPDCPVSIEGAPSSIGHRQEWNGQFIGSGNMTLAKFQPGESLTYELTFLKPWRSTSRVRFDFKKESDGTRVKWSMDATMPVFLFFMKKTMMAFISMDYDRGLGMLKEALETGRVPALTKVIGVEERPDTYYAGLHRSCRMSEVGTFMAQDFAELGKRHAEGDAVDPDHVVSVYHSFDPVRDVCDYTAGFFYRSEPSLPKGWEVELLPAHRALRVDHQGPYRHLGNAWAAAMGCARAQHKLIKRLPPYEIYVDDPQKTPEEKLRTAVYVPIRG